MATARAAGDSSSGGAGSDVCREANVVRLRGLPFSATKQDILTFFAQHDIVDRIVSGNSAVNLLLRANGRSSGQARVQMKARSDAELAQRLLHGQWMGSRYIEVFLSSDDSHGAAAGGEAAANNCSSACSTATAEVRADSKNGSSTAPGAALQALSHTHTQLPTGKQVPIELRQACPTQQQHQQAVAEAAAAAAFQALSAPWMQSPWGGATAMNSVGVTAMEQQLAAATLNNDTVSWEALFDFLDPEAAAAADAAWRNMNNGFLNYPSSPQNYQQQQQLPPQQQHRSPPIAMPGSLPVSRNMEVTA
jgi:hypothetical protein